MGTFAPSCSTEVVFDSVHFFFQKCVFFNISGVSKESHSPPGTIVKIDLIMSQQSWMWNWWMYCTCSAKCEYAFYKMLSVRTSGLHVCSSIFAYSLSVLETGRFLVWWHIAVGHGLLHAQPHSSRHARLITATLKPQPNPPSPPPFLLKR